MASYAKPDEFDPENEEWSAYVERMELFFEAHDVEDEKQVATLLSLLVLLHTDCYEISSTSQT